MIQKVCDSVDHLKSFKSRTVLGSCVVIFSFDLIYFYLRTIEGDRALATFSGKAMHQSKHQLAMDVYLLTFWFGMSSYCFYLILKHVDAKLVTGKCVGVLVCTRAKK